MDTVNATPVPDSRAGRCCSTVRKTNDLCGQLARPGSHLCQRCADYLDHAPIPDWYPGGAAMWTANMDTQPDLRLPA